MQGFSFGGSTSRKQTTNKNDDHSKNVGGSSATLGGKTNVNADEYNLENSSVTINSSDTDNIKSLIGGVNSFNESATDVFGQIVKGIGNFQSQAVNNLKVQTDALNTNSASARSGIGKLLNAGQGTKGLDINQTTLIKYAIIGAVLVGAIYSANK